MTETYAHSTAVQDEIERHAFSDVRREVGGILVGTFRDGVAHVSGSLPALKAVGSQTNVTFTHGVWEQVHDEIDRNHAGKRIVGWYHTHPGFGLFLSEYDQFIHRNFFSDERMLALVVDPKAGQLGWFVWRDGDIVLDSTHPTSTAVVGATSPAVASADGRWRRYVIAIPALLLASAVGGYLLGQQDASVVPPTASQRAAEAQRQLDAARAQAEAAQQEASHLQERVKRLKSEAAATESADQVSTVDYRVRPGDTLWGIASSLYGDGSSYSRLLVANQRIRPNRLEVGQVVRVPLGAESGGTKR